MQASAEQPGVAAVASKKCLEASALTAAAESRQLQGPNAAEVVKVEADNLYTEDSSLLGLRVKVYWQREGEWFRGRIGADIEEQHYPALQIYYDDGDCEDVMFSQNFTKVIIKEQIASGTATDIKFLGCKPVWAPGSSTPKAAEAAAAAQPAFISRKRALQLSEDDDDDDEDGTALASYRDSKRRNLNPDRPAAAGARKRLKQGSGQGNNDLRVLQDSSGDDSSDGGGAGQGSDLSSGYDSDSQVQLGRHSSQRQEAAMKRSASKQSRLANKSAASKLKQGILTSSTAAGGLAGKGNLPAAAGGVGQPSPGRQQQHQQSQPGTPLQLQQAVQKPRTQPSADHLKAAMKRAAITAQQQQAARAKTVILGRTLQSGTAGATAPASSALLRRVSSSGNVAGRSPAATVAGKSPAAALAGRSPATALTSPPQSRPAGTPNADSAASAKAAALQALLGGAVAPLNKPKANISSVARPRPHHQELQKEQQSKQQQNEQQPQRHQQQQKEQQPQQQKAKQPAQSHQEHKQQAEVVKVAAVGGSAAALAAVLAGGSSTGGTAAATSANIGPSSGDIAAAAARRRAAEQTWVAVLAAMPVSGKGIKEVGSKALEMCSVIGPQRVVTAVIEQMGRLPYGPGRVNLLYLIDSTLKQAQKLLPEQMNKYIADLPNKVSAGLTQLVEAAVYDLESLKKVKHLLDLWCKNGRVVASYAKLAYARMEVFERDATAAQRAAAEAAALGIPAGMQVQRIVLAAHECLEDTEEPKTTAAAAIEGQKAAQATANGQQTPAPAAVSAATAAADGDSEDPRLQQQQRQQQKPEHDHEFLEMYGDAPGSPSEAILAALTAEVDDDSQQGSGSSSKQQQQQQYQRYRNLFGPDTVTGYMLNQYVSLHGLFQLPFSAAVNQLAAANAGSAAQQRDVLGKGFLLQLRNKGLQLQLAPEILADKDYQTAFVEEDLADTRLGTWKQLLQPLDQAREAEEAAAIAENGDEQQQMGGSADQWEDQDAGGRSGSYQSPLGTLVCPAAPQREDRAENSVHNNAAATFASFGFQWPATAAAAAGGMAAGFSFSQPSQGLGVTSLGLGGPMGLVSAPVGPGPINPMQQQNMVAAAIEAARAAGLGPPQQRQQPVQPRWQSPAAAGPAAAAPAWQRQLDELMQQQQGQDHHDGDDNDQQPPLPPEDPADAPATGGGVAHGKKQQQQQQPGASGQQQAPRRFVVPGAPDDDDDDEDDMYTKDTRRTSAFMASDDDDGFVPPLPAEQPPEGSPDQPPLPHGQPPIGMIQDTSPIYDPDEDDGQQPPLPTEEPPLSGGGWQSSQGVTAAAWQQQDEIMDMDMGGDDVFGHQQQQQGVAGMGMGMQMNMGYGAAGFNNMQQQQQFMQQQQQQQMMMMGKMPAMGMGMGAMQIGMGMGMPPPIPPPAVAVPGQFNMGMTGNQQAFWPQQQQQHLMQPGMYQQQPYQ